MIKTINVDAKDNSKKIWWQYKMFLTVIWIY